MCRESCPHNKQLSSMKTKSRIRLRTCIQSPATYSEQNSSSTIPIVMRTCVYNLSLAHFTKVFLTCYFMHERGRPPSHFPKYTALTFLHIECPYLLFRSSAIEPKRGSAYQRTKADVYVAYSRHFACARATYA